MVILDHALLESDLGRLKEEERFYLIIERDKDRRTISDPLRKYYFSVVMHYISELTGHASDLIHEQMKEKFLEPTVDKFGFKILPSVFSDGSTMSVEDKWDFIMEVRLWASDFLNLPIPDPEKVVD